MFAANNQRKLQFIEAERRPDKLVVRKCPFVSVLVRKKGGRQFQAVILEGVTDFSCLWGVGVREPPAFLFPQAPNSFGLCGV